MIDDPDGSLDRRIEVARQSGVPPKALERYEQSRRGGNTGIVRAVAPDRELVPGVEVETDLGALAGDRDPGPRAVARLSAPARERPGDLGRPPARPDLALLRLRPHARSGGRVHRRPRRGRQARAHDALPRRPRAPVSRHPGEGRGQPRRARRPPRPGPRARSPASRGRRSRSSATWSAPRTTTRRWPPGACRSRSPTSTTWRCSGEVEEVEGSDPRRWRLA